MANISSCGCGCSKCSGHTYEPDCCGLDCLDRPNFFCGQLVTDQDFNKLVEWVNRKHALQRYLHGWGVVCGLDVTVDPCQSATITVSTGYGIDCCGRDLVVCEPSAHSLEDDYCKPKKGPCNKESAGETGATGKEVNLGGLVVPAAELTRIDLFLSYAEELSRPVRQASPGACSSPPAACQYTRVRQTGKVTTRLAVDPLPPRDRRTAYMEDLGRLSARLNSMETVDQLARYLASDYGHEFGGARRFGFVPQLREMAAARYWVMQDWFLSRAVTACPECDDTTIGIPLARVYLRKWMDDQKKSHCCVLYVEKGPAFRRGLRLDKPELTDYSNWLWRPKAELPGIASAAFKPAAALDELSKQFMMADWQAPSGTKVRAMTAEFEGDMRVAFFQVT